MNVYVYAAALHCEACGEGTRRRINPPPGADLDNESTYDSDAYPKGPYPNGGGEADSPQHCDQCGLFLENPLTPDGLAYVRGACEPQRHGTTEAETIAARLESAGYPVKAEWARFYPEAFASSPGDSVHLCAWFSEAAGGWLWDTAEDSGGFDRISPNGPFPSKAEAQSDAEKTFPAATWFDGLPDHYPVESDR